MHAALNAVNTTAAGTSSFCLDLFNPHGEKLGEVEGPPIYEDMNEAYDAAQVAILYLDDNGRLPNLSEKLGKL